MKLDPAALGMLAETVGAGNPMLKGVADLLISALGEDEPEQKGRDEAREQRRQRARRHLRRVTRDIEGHRQRNAFLAGALGACECWGQAPRCPICRGRGGAGFFEPDRAAFMAIVAPLLEARRALVEQYLGSREDTARAEARPFSGGSDVRE